MNDLSLACFLTVVHTGSFSATARELAVTQQSVSRIIQNLEDELGFPLLNRGSQTVGLTWAGERYYRHCLEYDQRLAQAIALFDPKRGKDPCRLTLAWCDWVGLPGSVLEAAHTMLHRFSGLHLNTCRGSVPELQELLDRGDVDLVLVPEHYASKMTSVIISQPLLQMLLYVYLRNDHPLAERPLELTRLAEFPQYVTSLGEATNDTAIHRAQSFSMSIGFFPRLVEVMPNVSSVFAEILCGDGYTICPLQTGAFKTSAFAAVPLPDMQATLVAATHQEHQNPLAAQFIRTYLEEKEGEA